ncbi:hypothetical protein [Tenacibaculum agarivorans]|uniref:hypothetical protein n=1 Tax=Tenacibaculum agarivorans TaxID=1908389 RepID=UPI00094B966A|nr:hypothetical protein [Tenacibaculum agarivorans]
MKNHLLHIILLFCSFLSYGQTYHVSVNNTLYYQNTGSASYCFRSNPASVPSVDGFLRLEDKNGNLLKDIDGHFTLTTRPARFIENSGKCRWIEGSNRGSTYSLGGYTFTIPENQNSYYEVKTFALAAPSAIYFEVEDNNIRELNCNGGSVISVPSVVPTSAIIEWEYLLNSSVGVVNNSQGKRSITVALNTFQENLRNHIGKTIYFRFKMKNGIQSSFKGYKIVSCSPAYHSTNVSNTVCNYSTDGSFKINFRRNLNANETLVITLYDGDNDAILYNQEFTKTLINNGNGTYGYQWQQPLDAGRYRVKYQTHNGNGGIATTDPSWDSLEFIPVFTIGRSEKVTFSITNDTDENCYAVNDGYIDVSAIGQPGNTFFYQYKKDGTTQVVAGQSWIPFTGSTTTRISGLGKATYRVQVRQRRGTKNCYAK